jgi:hypothetical protein
MLDSTSASALLGGVSSSPSVYERRRQTIDESVAASSKSFKDLIEMINQKFEEINDLKDKYCMMDDKRDRDASCMLPSTHARDSIISSSLPFETSESASIAAEAYKSEQPLRSRAYSSYKLNETSSQRGGEADSRSRRAQNEAQKMTAPTTAEFVPPAVKVKSKSCDHKCERIYSKFDQLIRNACDMTSLNAQLAASS